MLHRFSGRDAYIQPGISASRTFVRPLAPIASFIIVGKHKTPGFVLKWQLEGRAKHRKRKFVPGMG